MTPEPSKWARMIAADPEHSYRYIERFKVMEAGGADLYGEARTVDAMVPRGSRILDAGCGPGRHAGWLHERGHQVVGVDLDPVLIDEAKRERPGPVFVVGDLAELDLPAQGIEAGFDIILSAGNVMGFLAPSTRVEVLRRFAEHLAPTGRAVIGFGAGRGYEFADFFSDAQAAGLVPELAFSTWELRPWRADSDFLVAMLARA
ncbi:MAG: class I SAM-dependent methyltransferase [Propionibacteriaceae bacterium]|nr:class I SAM-dependent methyltransferase [Propionibacteriaceae bacterium]